VSAEKGVACYGEPYQMFSTWSEWSGMLFFIGQVALRMGRPH
jgi:hypothetical protein